MNTREVADYSGDRPPPVVLCACCRPRLPLAKNTHGGGLRLLADLTARRRRPVS
jgi:hypothetical protein